MKTGAPAWPVLLLAVTSALSPATRVEAQSPAVIYGCVSVLNVLRVVSATTPCLRSETRISWNAQGPQGRKGDAGPQGPARAPGGSALEMVDRNGAVLGKVLDANRNEARVLVTVGTETFEVTQARRTGFEQSNNNPALTIPQMAFLDAGCSGQSYVSTTEPTAWLFDTAFIVGTTAWIPDSTQPVTYLSAYPDMDSATCQSLPPTYYYRESGQCVAGRRICGGSPPYRAAKPIDLSGFVPPFSLR